MLHRTLNANLYFIYTWHHLSNSNQRRTLFNPIFRLSSAHGTNFNTWHKTVYPLPSLSELSCVTWNCSISAINRFNQFCFDNISRDFKRAYLTRVIGNRIKVNLFAVQIQTPAVGCVQKYKAVSPKALATSLIPTLWWLVIIAHFVKIMVVKLINNFEILKSAVKMRIFHIRIFPSCLIILHNKACT